VNKYYAVKVGRNTGIFTSWSDCNKQVKGFSGAIYKAFTTVKDAEDFLKDDTIKVLKNDEPIQHTKSADTLLAYVDGSYSKELNKYSYGCVLIAEKEKTILSGIGDKPDITTMQNVAGELLGAMKAIKWAVEHKFKSIVIFHDYEGISRWAKGDWKSNKIGTNQYVEFIRKYENHINIEFKKVLAHSGDMYNDEADKVAKEALRADGCNVGTCNEEGKRKSIFYSIINNNDKDRVKYSFRIKFKDFYISERKLRKFVNECWKADGRSESEIDTIDLSVDSYSYDIVWQVVDKSREVHHYRFALD